MVAGESEFATGAKTADLVRYRACCFLGSAGLGKTYELAELARHEREDGADVRLERLAMHATSPERLQSRLETLASGATERTAIYLDALDEAMVPLRMASLVLAGWIRTDLATSRPTLRISCRSAVWPSEVASAIREVYEAQAIGVAVLQPLLTSDIRDVAALSGADADRFLKAVVRARAETLAAQPLTLMMLLRVFAARGGQLPPSRRALFQEGMDLLAREREERRELGTAPTIPPTQILDAAERLACFSLLSGREVIDLGDGPPPTALGWIELSALPGGERTLDEELLRGVGYSALGEGDGPLRFRFAHRQYAEYLAGRRIARLLPHQAKSLLASGLGWEAGVAGPLREVAAFAAMESPELAAWVAERDPEVIGLSDVADDALRRRGMLQLLDRFRRHELTDAQISRDSLQLRGFQCSGIEADLRPVLRERGAGAEDVLECAVELVEGLELAVLSEELADLALDQGAPLHPRVSAAHALERFGTREARLRLKPLIAVKDDDPDRDLKGLALRCNWPDNLTTPEVLAAITPQRNTLRYGAYEGFIHRLDTAEFDAAGHVVDGLKWAQQFLRRRADYDPAVRIAKRIAARAVQQLGEPGVLDALADVLVEASRTHGDSPLSGIRRELPGRDEPLELPPPLVGNTDARRSLLDALAAKTEDDLGLWWMARETPGLLLLEDFPWLLDRAVDDSRPMPHRERYVEFAQTLPWLDDQASVQAWLHASKVEPVASRIAIPLSVDVESETAAKARKQHADAKRWSKPPRRRKLRPPPVERVRRTLDWCETKDPRFFLNLCQELTLQEDSTHYGFERFLTQSPGWKAADAPDRDRIVRAAKGLLTAGTDEPGRARTEPLNTILTGYMEAIWLVLDVDPNWIEALPDEWWRRWTWYILRELHPNMSGESSGPKEILMSLLHSRAPEAVRNALLELATTTGQESHNLLTPLLETFHDTVDAALDQGFCDLIEAGTVSPDRIGTVARFVLGRDVEQAMPVCVTRLDRAAAASAEEIAVRAALALLSERTVESWDHVLAFLRERRDLAPRILAEFAHGREFRHGRNEGRSGLEAMTPSRAGQLVGLLLELFPPPDPKFDGGIMRGVTPEDSAREMRNRLINWLSEQRSVEAVLALRQLESTYGAKHPWLRRPRSQAERAYRQSRWGAIPPQSVAELLDAGSKRLIRSERDALEGVREAIETYARNLRHKSPSDLEDLWNLPKGRAPTPKAEERVSDKLCQAIREYFERFAVTADREVQVFRRKLPRDLGGAPGSEVDVLARVPAAGSTEGDAIAIPVEVKLSNTPEARSGLRAQLVDRYMSELGTSHGAFVVVWMHAPNLAPAHRPIWSSFSAAAEELNEQARQVSESTKGAATVAALVVDATLVVTPRAPQGRKKKKKTTRKNDSKAEAARATSKTGKAERSASNHRASKSTVSKARGGEKDA